MTLLGRRPALDRPGVSPSWGGGGIQGTVSPQA